MDSIGFPDIGWRGISQEKLKLIACISMLIDHVGAVLLPWSLLRIIGRIAFPIYCFLLAEGSHYTRNPKRYALRLGIGAVLSELPFDLAFFHGWTWRHQSVMLTLLIGFLALQAMKKVRNPIMKYIIAIPFAAVAELLCTDYGGDGVLLIAVFGIAREMERERLIQLLGMLAVCGLMGSAHILILGIRVPVELFAVLAIIPIWLYSGKKESNAKAAQLGFYLFYPVHILLLWILRRVI